MKFFGYYKFKRLLLKSIRFKSEENILIFADPRGGSTWLAEVMKGILKKPILWEPLHVGKIKQLQQLKFSYRQYIPEDASWDDAHSYFDDLFNGKIISNWIYHREPMFNFVTNKSVIIKLCRGNLLIPYIVKNFSFNKKPIYLIRHPFAVVASQLKQGGWDNTGVTFKLGDYRYNEHYLKHESFLKTLSTKEEVLTATWCLTNQSTLINPNNDREWITVTYEEMVLEPKETLVRILKRWGVSSNLNTINFKKKSDTSIQKKPLSDEERLNQWRKVFSKDQIFKMDAVLKYFEVEHYSSEEVLPLIKYNDAD